LRIFREMRLLDELNPVDGAGIDSALPSELKIPDWC
jgi:hypothetical protein